MFDDRFAAAMKLRFGERPPSERPELYDVATLPSREAQREWMNRSLSKLPEPGRSRLFRQLSTSRGFFAAASELAVAALLQEAGLEPSSQTAIQGLTPDLVVNDPPVVVEIWTSHQPEGIKRALRRWRHLADRVNEIPVPVVLHVIGPRREEMEAPDARQSKQIAKGIRSWLLGPSSTPGIGAARRIGPFLIRVAEQAPGARAMLYVPRGGVVADSSTVRDAINSKVTRYREVVRATGAAFTVVLCAEPGAALDANLVKSALSGSESVTLTFDPFSAGGQIMSRKMSRWSRGAPESFDPVLSAVGWLDAQQEKPGVLKIFSLETANLRFPPIHGPGIVWEEIAAGRELTYRSARGPCPQWFHASRASAPGSENNLWSFVCCVR